jgi:O-antigen ligase
MNINQTLTGEYTDGASSQAAVRRAPPLIPLIAATPVLFAVTTWPSLSSVWPATDFNRFFSIPVTITEIIVVIFAVMRGIDIFAPMRGERPWVWAALITLILVAFGTAQFVAVDGFVAWLRTLAWGVHLLFGFSVAGLAQRYWAGRAAEVWCWILAGLTVHLAMIALYVATLEDPNRFDWEWFGLSVINVRQLGFYSAAGFSIAIGVAIMAKGSRERWIAVGAASLMIALTFWSGTRSSLFSSIAALMIAGVIFREARSIRSVCLSLTALIAGAALSLVHVAPEYLMGLSRMFDTSISGDVNGVSSGRTKVWKSTAHTISKRPVLGYGESQFKIVEPSVEGVFNHPHNSILQFLFQWGFLGAGCFFVLFALLANRLRLAIRDNVDDKLPAGLVVVNLFAMSQIEGSFYHPYPVMITVFSLAFALGYRRASPKPSVAL